MYRKFKIIKAFTLIELVIIIASISVLGAILVTFINPVRLISNARNSTRSYDLGMIHTAINNYLADSTSRYMSDFAGFSQLVSNAQQSLGGSCDGASTKGISSLVAGPFNIDILGSNIINISPLIANGYLNQIPKDPLSKVDYQICIDTIAGNSVIIFATGTEGNTNYSLANLGSLPYISINPSPVFKQSNSAVNSSVTSQNISLLSSVQPGNALIVSINSTSNNVISVSDNLGNAFYKIYADTTSLNRLSMWYAQNVKGGIDTITVLTPTTNISTSVTEYLGLGNNILIDQINHNSGSSTINATTGATNSTTKSNELIFGVFSQNTGIINATQGSGYTLRTLQNQGSIASLYTEDLISNTVGSFNPGLTFASNASYTSCVITFW